MESYKALRDAWDRYTKSKKVILKSKSDLEGFLLFAETGKRSSVAHYLHKKDGDIKRLRKDVCCAFKQGYAGFDALDSVPSHKQFAAKLAEAGIPCKVTDVENGRRLQFEKHTTPRTPRVIDACSRLQIEFPTFDPDVVLEQER